MSIDTKIKTLIFNKLTQEQYDNADRVPTEFYLTPDTSIDSSEKGAANGVASLDTNGKVPTEQIPVATTSALGGVKPDGNTITVTEDGTISATVSGDNVATKAELQAVDSSKADTALSNVLANIDYVVESQVNADGSWYRKYKSGWLEQGGIISPSSAWSTINLLKPYANTQYIILAAVINGNTGAGVTIKDKTISSFAIYQNVQQNWEAKGMGAN